ncbi:MAG: hypothetical protein AAGA29_04770 [Planctomycetota bacterium]
MANFALSHDRGSVALALLSNLREAGRELGPSNDTSAALNLAAYLADRIETDQARSGGGIPEVSGNSPRPSATNIHWADSSAYLTGKYLLEAAQLLPTLERTKPSLSAERLTAMARRLLDCAAAASLHGPARALPSQSLPAAPHYPAKQRAWEPQLAYHTLSTASILRLCGLMSEHITDRHRAMADGMADWLASLTPDAEGDYATFYSMHDGRTPVFGSADGRDVFDEADALQSSYRWRARQGVVGALRKWSKSRSLRGGPAGAP